VSAFKFKSCVTNWVAPFLSSSPVFKLKRFSCVTDRDLSGELRKISLVSFWALAMNVANRKATGVNLIEFS
jgi:hypothetical protein